jgi:hypothetical protein
MLEEFCRTSLECHRVPEVELVQVAYVETDHDDRSEGQQSRRCNETIRVVLRRSPSNSRDPKDVHLFTLAGQQIGQLPAQIAAQVTLLPDSNRTAFDAEIWSDNEFPAGDRRSLLACTIAMRQFERVLV